MAESSKSKTGGRSWTQRLDAEQVREALEDATIDAYGEYEQHTALLTAIGDELAFPFRAKVLGEVVSVGGMEWPEDDEFGLIWSPNATARGIGSRLGQWSCWSRYRTDTSF